jgi:hypothetical protein
MRDNKSMFSWGFYAYTAYSYSNIEGVANAQGVYLG